MHNKLLKRFTIHKQRNDGMEARVGIATMNKCFADLYVY